jgi:hypothetical protein
VSVYVVTTKETIIYSDEVNFSQMYLIMTYKHVSFRNENLFVLAYLKKQPKWQDDTGHATSERENN